MSKFFNYFMSGAVALSILGGVAVANYAAADDSTVVVTAADLTTGNTPMGWYFYNDVTGSATATVVAGDYEMVDGPSTPPAGDGSVEMSVEGSERFNIATYQYAGTNLVDITTLAFSTYQPSSNEGSSDRAIYLNFDVDFNNTTTTGYQGRLVYVPRDNGTVSEDSWQDWGTLVDSMWRWSAYSGGTFNTNAGAIANQWPDGDTDELRSWSEIVAAFPNAEMFNESFTGQLLLRAGEPYADGFTGNVDAVMVGVSGTTTTYDFELVASDYQAPPVPQHLSPSNGVTLTSAELTTIDWTDVVDDTSDTVVYVYQSSLSPNINGDGSFVSPAFTSGELTESEISAAGTPEGTYYWHVRAIDENDNTSVWSDAWTIIVDNDSDEEPTVPTTKDECKNGGWMDFENPTFRNQGQCVSYVAARQNQ